MWTLLAGVELDTGLHQFLTHRSQFDWISSVLMGAGFLGFGIFWTVLLVRRAAGRIAG
jgi:hypothetical protein